MKRLLIYLCGCLLCFISTGSYVLAQSQLAGHMLDQINLDVGETESVLNIEGSIATELLSGINIVPGDSGSMTLRIIIPNAFINTLTLPQQLNFNEGNLLESVRLEEQIQKEADDSISFRVILHLQLLKEINIQFDEVRSDDKKITFLVTPKQKKKLEDAEEEDAAMVETTTSAPAAKVQATSSRTLQSMDKDHKSKKKAKSTQGMPMQYPVPALDAVLLHPVSAMMVYRKPTRLQLSILNASSYPNVAHRLAILLERHQRRNLENRVGMKLQITNISSVKEKTVLPKTKIYFRPNYLSAALALAQAIPGEQIIERMAWDRRGKLGIDVEIYVGENFE